MAQLCFLVQVASQNVSSKMAESITANRTIALRNCGRQLVQDPQNKPIDQATKDLIDKLLLERLSLAGIARVTGVSELWLQRYVNAKYADVPRRVRVSAKKRGD